MCARVPLLFLATVCFFSIALQGRPDNGGFEIPEPNRVTVPKDWYFQDIIGPRGNLNDIQLHSLLNNPDGGNVWIEKAFEKDSFVVLSSGNPYTESENYLSAIEQLITLEPGDTLYGAYFFGTTDYTPYNDTAFGKLIDPSLQLISNSRLALDTDADGNFTYLSNIPANDTIHPEVGIELFRVSVTDVGSYMSTRGWRTFEYHYDGQDPATFRLYFQVRDSSDNILSSYLALDGLRICRAGPDFGDLNHDCSIDYEDFAILSRAWLADCSEPNVIADPNIPCSLIIQDPNSPNKMIDTEYLLPMSESWLEWFGYEE